MSDPIVSHVFPVISGIAKSFAEFLVTFWPTITVSGLTIAAISYVFDWVDPDDGAIYGIWIMLSVVPLFLFIAIPIFAFMAIAETLDYFRREVKIRRIYGPPPKVVQEKILAPDPYLVKATEEVDTLLQESSL
jgi:hypothetical protein